MKLRSALRILSHELGLKGRYTYDDVIVQLRARYPNLIADEAKTLETIALKRILCDVDARQVRNSSSGQSELFPELAGFPGSYNARAVGLQVERGVRVLLQLLPVKTVRAIASHTKPPKKNSSIQAKLKTYLDDLSPHLDSDEEIFGDVIKRSRE